MATNVWMLERFVGCRRQDILRFLLVVEIYSDFSIDLQPLQIPLKIYFERIIADTEQNLPLRTGIVSVYVRFGAQEKPRDSV